MSWGGLNDALTAWRDGIVLRFPGRGTASDGARADDNHSGASQHQEDDDGTVDAYDMDVNLQGSGVEAGTAAERRLIEALKLDFEGDPHGRGLLWIHQREIANATIDDWRKRRYNGPNPHDKHVHWESRQPREDDGREWPMPHTDELLRTLKGDEDVTPEDIKKIADATVTALLTADVIPGVDDRGVDLPEDPADPKKHTVTIRTVLYRMTRLSTAVTPARFFTVLDRVADERAESPDVVAKAILAELGGGATQEEKAQLLRAALGDDAAAVGRLLAAAH